MPIYEYHCNECGHEFEVMQKITDKPIRKCEKCGRLKAKRMISHTSFVLKGSGWYVTDYGGKKSTDLPKPSGNGKESGDKAGADSKSSGVESDKVSSRAAASA